MEFSRHHDFRVDYIRYIYWLSWVNQCLLPTYLVICLNVLLTFFSHSETLSVVSFTDLLNIIVKFYDSCESNKAEVLIWGRR